MGIDADPVFAAPSFGEGDEGLRMMHGKKRTGMKGTKKVKMHHSTIPRR
jgi:hypothetical protein